jgi:hypothetical protein
MSAEEKARLILNIKEFFHDASIGIVSAIVSFQIDWNTEIPKIIEGLLVALVCCAGVHYFKKLLKWIDKKLKI